VSSSVSLTNAVTSGDERAVSALLANGADVNESTSGGQTALILAVIFGHTNLVQLLIKAGADPQRRDNLGLNAVDWAQRRGLSEALDSLTNGSKPHREPSAMPVRPRIQIPTETSAETEDKETVSADEKSRRWIAGLKQRLHEQELKRLNRNEALAEVHIPEDTPSPLPIVAIDETPAAEEIETPVVETISDPQTVQTVSTTIAPSAPSAKPSSSGNRKRCPKCNAIYNGELVSYCAHHIVPLVDADAPIISEPPKNSPPLFWILVVITLTGSIVVGSLITTYLYKSNQASAGNAAQPTNIQKGSPEVGGELVGKAVSLPEAECPVNRPEALSGTVTVRVMVDKNGQVYWARGAGGDWLMRGASTEAAMKSTFSREKLRGRETEGTITYTFKPEGTPSQ
jgi:hypothetical protein